MFAVDARARFLVVVVVDDTDCVRVTIKAVFLNSLIHCRYIWGPHHLRSHSRLSISAIALCVNGKYIYAQLRSRRSQVRSFAFVFRGGLWVYVCVLPSLQHDVLDQDTKPLCSRAPVPLYMSNSKWSMNGVHIKYIIYISREAVHYRSANWKRTTRHKGTHTQTRHTQSRARLEQSYIKLGNRGRRESERSHDGKYSKNRSNQV